jgi:hypothetical protein
MKKVIYFLILMSAMTLLNVGCEKPTDDSTDPTVKTLAQQYPDWVNLNYVETKKNGILVAYPTVSFKLIGNTVTIIVTASANSIPATQTYDKITLTTTVIGLYDSVFKYTTNFTYTKSGNPNAIYLIPSPDLGGIVYKFTY